MDAKALLLIWDALLYCNWTGSATNPYPAAFNDLVHACAGPLVVNYLKSAELLVRYGSARLMVPSAVGALRPAGPARSLLGPSIRHVGPPPRPDRPMGTYRTQG